MQDDPPSCDLASCRCLTLEVSSTPIEVRGALQRILASPPMSGVAEDLAAQVELVLAEVLNNIVEHAYAAKSGRIRVSISRLGGGIDCCVCDAGCPMPGLAVPAGALPEWQEGPPPEGGFGWHLIRALTDGLSYRRTGNCNELRFQLGLHHSLPAG